MRDDEFNKLLSQTVFVIEANSFEVMKLWEYYNHLGWEQQPVGCLETIGRLAKMPVCISCFWVRLCGQLIMFIEPTSQVFDHRILEKWRNKNCNPKWDNGTREASCDAMNFHHAVDHCKTLAIKKNTKSK